VGAIVDGKPGELPERRTNVVFPASSCERVRLTFFKIGHGQHMGMLAKNYELNFA
jgi:hypothetical protein